MKGLIAASLLCLTLVFSSVGNGHATKRTVRKHRMVWKVTFMTIGFDRQLTTGVASLQILGRDGTKSKRYSLSVGRGTTTHDITSKYIGPPTSIQVNFKHSTDSWNLKQIELSRHGDLDNKYIFRCWCWVNNAVITLQPHNPLWLMTVYTSKTKQTYTDRLWIRITGTHGKKSQIFNAEDTINFRTGRKVAQVKQTNVIGAPISIEVRHETYLDSKTHLYYLDKIEFERAESRSKTKYVFDCHSGLKEYKVYPLRIANPRWRISTLTGSSKGADTQHGVIISLIGTERNSSVALLNNPRRFNFLRGAWDQFIVSTKDIGTLKAVLVGMLGYDEFYIVQVQVEQMGTFDKIAVFYADSWIRNFGHKYMTRHH